MTLVLQQQQQQQQHAEIAVPCCVIVYWSACVKQGDGLKCSPLQ